jgi:hypothetical protein
VVLVAVPPPPPPPPPPVQAAADGGYPYHPRLLSNASATGEVVSALLRSRAAAEVEALHARADVGAHLADLEVLLLGLGNAALPGHLHAIGAHASHPEYSVRAAAVQVCGFCVDCGSG